MSINRVEMPNFVCIGTGNIDEEEKRILKRLLIKYGISGTGNKTQDKALLHKLELEEAKLEDTISSKFLIVTKFEQENIQNKKKEKRIENSPKELKNNAKGAKALGEQIYLAIQMKKDLEKKLKENKTKV